MSAFLHRAARATAEENPLWLIVLCDLMTNLMLFFLVMYSFSLQDAAARERWVKAFRAEGLVAPDDGKAAAIVEQFKEDEAARRLVDALKAGPLADRAEVSATERSVRVSLRDRLLFGSADARLSPSAAGTLSQLAAILREIPHEVVVEGHTDDVPVVSGPYRTNWELSVARSREVLERLLAEGVPASRLVCAGYGPHRPVAANATAEGRAANRRVELVILRPLAGEAP